MKLSRTSIIVLTAANSSTNSYTAFTSQATCHYLSFLSLSRNNRNSSLNYRLETWVQRPKPYLTTVSRLATTLLPMANDDIDMSSLASYQETAVMTSEQVVTTTATITTVFSITNCPFCTRAKSLLSSKGIPFVEINISKYPRKRADMLDLSDRLTVPQIFFGNTFIGGSDDLTAWFATHDTDDVLSFGPPTTEQLSLPTYPPEEEEAAQSPTRTFDQFQILIDVLPCDTAAGSKVTAAASASSATTTNPYVQIALLLENKLPLANIDGHKKVISSIDLEYFLSTWVGVDKTKSATDELLKSDMIVPVASLTKSNTLSFYRLYQHSQPLVLNSFRKWKETAAVLDPVALVYQLKKKIDILQTRYTNEQNGLVDYISLASDVEFAAFDEATCELQNVSLAKMSEQTRLAFVIMLYNLMIKHAFAKIGTPGTPVGPFFEHVRYNVGSDMLFSFSELENGILRGNRIPPGHDKPVLFDDRRKEVALTKVDSRIHFALNCGASSCPPIKKYTADAIEEELRIAAMSFVESDENIRLDMEHGTVYLNQIFNWYSVDFGNNPTEVAMSIVSFLRGEKRQQLERILNEIAAGSHGGQIKLEFMKYDWSTDSKLPRPFALENFKVDP